MDTPAALTDPFGRRFQYLRLSITEICNFRCAYCLPNGYQKQGDQAFLSLNELRRLASAFTHLGVWKIRLTGGEPTIRPDFIEIATALSGISALKTLALTTNGYNLATRAQSYFHAGIRSINVSIDSLTKDRFHAITGHNTLTEILRGVDACLDVGFNSVKINTVLLKDTNSDEIEGFLAFLKDKKVSLRFIELMRTNDNVDFFKARHLSGKVVQSMLEQKGWSLLPKLDGSGPALEYAHPNYLGTVGLIMPYSEDFCKSCNRLRVSAKGNLHLCLFGEDGYPLRQLLSSDDQTEELADHIAFLLQYKKSQHRLHENISGSTRQLAMIGG